MSETKQQEQGAAPAKVRGDMELFWRIIAGLIVIVIGWSLWVLYQITPRSVVTPLVYESEAKRIAAQKSANGAAAATASPQSPAAAGAAQPGAGASTTPQASSEPAAADTAMDRSQAAARSSADQASAGIPAAAPEKREEHPRSTERQEGLKLSTEITTPLVERKSVPKEQ